MINRTILRFLTRKCLDGATIAGAGVFDSAIDPLDKRVTIDPAPAIIVYTDDQKQEYGTSRLPDADTTDLVIELVVASAVEAGEGTVVEIAASDDGFELTLDLLEHEIEHALFGTGQWPDLWKSLVTKRDEKVSRRGAPDGGGARWAARQITMKVRTLPTPPAGAAEPAAGPWADILAAFAADADLMRYADVFRSYLFPGELSPRDALSVALGVSTEDASELGLGAMGLDGEEPAVLQEVAIDETVAPYTLQIATEVDGGAVGTFAQFYTIIDAGTSGTDYTGLATFDGGSALWGA